MSARLRTGPGEPDRRAHRLQRRPGAAVRHRAGHHGDRRGRAAAATSPSATRWPPSWGSTPPAVEIESDLPAGAGLSSSAALCAALALALGGERDRWELARLCQRVENDHLGARTGLLDQIAVLMAPPGGALLIDFSDLSTTPVALDLGGWRLAVLDSGERHAHADVGLQRAPRRVRAGRPAPAAPRGERERARAPGRGGAARPATCPGWPRCWTPPTPACATTTRCPPPRSRPRATRCWRRARPGARIMGGGFGGSVLGLFPPGARPPAGALAVQPGRPARVLVHLKDSRPWRAIQ